LLSPLEVCSRIITLAEKFLALQGDVC